MLLKSNNVYKLDGKNRFSLPRALKKTGRKFYMTRGLDGCVLLYPQSEWENIISKVSPMDYFKGSNRKFLRLFFESAREASSDAHSRLLLPQRLKEAAGIRDRVLLIKIARWWELWSPGRFEKYRKAHEKTYEYYAGKLDIKI